ACRLQNPSPDFENNRAFGKRIDERSGTQDAPHRVAPPQESLRANHRAIAHAHLRLKIENEFSVPPGASELGVELPARLRLCAHHRQEQAIAPATGCLGVVKRQIGIRNELLNAQAIGWSDCYAGARTNEK